MPLPLGAWQINVNGVVGRLDVGNFNPTTGVLRGQISGALGDAVDPFSGTWNETAQCLMFVIQQSNIDGFFRPQFFRGLLFRTPASDAPDRGQDILWTLAGSVWDVDSSGPAPIKGTGRRNEFGWFAQFTQVV